MPWGSKSCWRDRRPCPQQARSAPTCIRGPCAQQHAQHGSLPSMDMGAPRRACCIAHARVGRVLLHLRELAESFRRRSSAFPFPFSARLRSAAAAAAAAPAAAASCLGSMFTLDALTSEQPSCSFALSSAFSGRLSAAAFEPPFCTPAAASLRAAFWPGFALPSANAHSHQR